MPDGTRPGGEGLTAAAPAAQASPRLLDGLRGLAALAVVFTHILSMAPPLPPALLAAMEATPLRLITTGRAPVIFFFVLSGYVLTLSLLKDQRPGLATFALRRSCRLLLPVAGAVLVSAALSLALRPGPLPQGGWDAQVLWSEPVGAAMVLRQALLLGADGWFTLDIPLWTLVHEWRITLLFPLVLLFRGRVAWLLGLALLLHVTAIALGVAPDRHQLGPRLPSTLLSDAYFLLPFVVGAALALEGQGGQLRPAWARRLAWAGILVAASLPHDLMVITASAALILLARGPGLLPRVLARPSLLWLGRVSFSLYLIHMPVLGALLHGLGGVLPPWAALLLGLPLALLAAQGFHALVEAPAQRLSRRIRLSAPPAMPARQDKPQPVSA
jgi:peptidoglycan/LPS O-acetylase OafA/YrhL